MAHLLADCRRLPALIISETNEGLCISSIISFLPFRATVWQFVAVSCCLQTLPAPRALRYCVLIRVFQINLRVAAPCSRFLPRQRHARFVGRYVVTRCALRLFSAVVDRGSRTDTRFAQGDIIVEVPYVGRHCRTDEWSAVLMAGPLPQRADQAGRASKRRSKETRQERALAAFPRCKGKL